MKFLAGILHGFRALRARLVDQRSATRHPVPPGFPVTLTLVRTGGGGPWPAVLRNVSVSGVGFTAGPDARLARGDKVELRLAGDGLSLAVAAVVAHFEAGPDGGAGGLFLGFNDVAAQRAFLELHDAIATGATLRSAPGVRDGPGPDGIVETYAGAGGGRLTIWRDRAGRGVAAFELVQGRCCVRGEAGRPGIGVYLRGPGPSPGAAARSAPGHALADAPPPEVERAFRWTAASVSEALPADVRALLAACAGRR